MKAHIPLFVIYLFSLFLTVHGAYVVHRDIPYDTIAGVNPNLLSLDIFVPENASGLLPVVIYVHGGTWQGGDKRVVGYKNDLFTENEYVFVSMNYRLSPSCPPCDTISENAVRFPTHPRDVGKGIAWVYNNIHNYNGNPQKIGLIGHSAGAHLVSLVSTDESYVEEHGISLSDIRCVCSLDAGVLDFPTQISMSNSDDYVMALKNAFGTDPQKWIDASPSYNIQTGENIPDFLLVHQNNPSRIQQNGLMLDSLHAHGHTGSTYGIDLTHGEINVYVGLTDRETFDRLVDKAPGQPSPNAFALAQQLTDTVLHFFNNHLSETSDVVRYHVGNVRSNLHFEHIPQHTTIHDLQGRVVLRQHVNYKRLKEMNKSSNIFILRKKSGTNSVLYHLSPEGPAQK